MARLKIIGGGPAGFSYQVFIDDQPRPDVQKLVITYEADHLVTADVTMIIEDLDVVAELSETEGVAMARRAEILFQPT